LVVPLPDVIRLLTRKKRVKNYSNTVIKLEVYKKTMYIQTQLNKKKEKKKKLKII